MTEIIQTQSELEDELNEQLQLLVMLTEQYDEGKRLAAKPMATAIRVLLHNTRTSHSLLELLKKQHVLFYDTAENIEDPKVQRVTSSVALVGISVNGTADAYDPYLDNLPHEPRFVSFDDYWGRVVIIDGLGSRFTRKDIILSVVNKDGGAHIDPALPEKYVALSRQNSLGWTASRDEGVENDLTNIELATIRQIAHEILKTFLPGYVTPVLTPSANMMIAGGGVIAVPEKKNLANVKVGRKDPCPCGSGKKFKRCHGS